VGAEDYAYADSRVEMIKAFRQNVYYGANWLKVVLGEQRFSYSSEDLAALVEEAHAAGVKVAAHAGSDAAARVAIEAGVDSIEHATLVSLETLRLMREKNIVLVPTDFSRSVLEGGGFPAEYVEWRTTVTRERLERALTAEVAIAFGSDLFWVVEGQTRGSAALSMLDLWTEAGMSPARILQGLITTPAALLDDATTRGKIQAGFQADLIATPDDPLTDPKALRRVQFVMKAGRVVRAPGR